MTGIQLVFAPEGLRDQNPTQPRNLEALKNTSVLCLLSAGPRCTGQGDRDRMSHLAHVLERFVLGEVAFPELRTSLAHSVRFSAQPDGSLLIECLSGPLPLVTFSVHDILRMIAWYQERRISADALSTWASMLTLLDCFELVHSDSNAKEMILDALDTLSVPSVSRVLEGNGLQLLQRDLQRIAAVH